MSKLTEVIELLAQNEVIAPLLGAAVIFLGVIVAWHHNRRMRRERAVATLMPLIDDARRAGAFEGAKEIVDDPLSPAKSLRECKVQDLMAGTLTLLDKPARIVSDPVAWERVLNGNEYNLTSDFLKRASPMVWAVRTGPLAFEGDKQFYNHNKSKAAQELYHAMKTDLQGIRWARWLRLLGLL